ncbi:hypothetical protein QTH91_15750 [Variovorax dokdonensis]|uniref:Uncharacterized protein n=1 Tax=Variovorax dokdonensis TaxID=344883 RepID=A0ABT7NDB8_9BURK|nr:hypothetical protein [Variovorax dokdonensis]MDM0045942.1 hypothetical protein [Variovorax dokdonensis]
MSQDRNPYYDSIRDKPDRSEFASLRAGLESGRRTPPPSNFGFLKIALIFVVVVVAAVVVKRFLL